MFLMLHKTCQHNSIENYRFELVVVGHQQLECRPLMQLAFKNGSTELPNAEGCDAREA